MEGETVYPQLYGMTCPMYDADKDDSAGKVHNVLCTFLILIRDVACHKSPAY